MKKIYLLLATLCGLFISLSASAQDEKYPYGYDVDQPIVTDPVQFYSPFSQNDLGNADGGNLADGVLIDDDASTFWHSCWSAGEGMTVPPGHHYLQIEIPEWVEEDTEIVLRFTRRSTSNDHTTEWSIRGTNEDVEFSEEESCEELMYASTPFTSNTETMTTEPFSTNGYRYIRLYSEVQHPSTRTYWHVSELNLYTIKPLTEWEAVNNELIAMADEYSYYLGTFELGDGPGQYSEEKYIAFEDAYNELVSINDDDPVERLKEVIQNLKDAYQALLDSKVTFALESGYYHIRAGMEYVNSVVVGQDEEGNDITEDQVRDKYMMGHKQDGQLWGIWGTPEDFAEVTQKIRPLFKVTRINGLYDIQSMMYDGRFTTVERSGKVVMDPNSESMMALDPAGTDENGINYVNIRVSTQNANDYFYLHQGGHSNGTGKNGFLVGWCTTWDAAPMASEWYFEPVDAAEAEAIIAEWAPNKDRIALLERYHKMYASADSAITAAKDVSQIAIVTDASQFSSPFSQNDLGNKDGGNLSDGVLIDGDATTFWHSCWSASGENVVPEGNHYLQIELTEEVTQPIYMMFTRRQADNDHTIKWSIRGTNDPEFSAEEESEELLNCETPYGVNTETLSTPTFETKGYKYIRIYSEEQKGSSYGTRTYWHVSELNLYYDQENPNSQYVGMGEIATNLEAVLAELADVADDDLTDEQYNKLEAAWNAFQEAFVDPAALRQALADVQGVTDQIEVGTQPGFWPDNSTAEALNKTIADATAYDAAGKYTKTQSATYIETLEAQTEAFWKAANPIKEGKWYRFRFGTEEEYDEHGWNKVGNDANIDSETEVMKDEALFGKYFTVADFESTEDGVKTVFPIEAEEVVMNGYIFLDSDEDIEDKDMSLWRFISVGDSAYAIQNKATGLFMVKKSTSAYILLGVHPALFTQKIAGYGQQAFLIKNVTGETMDPLHAALSYNIVQTYRNYGDSDGRRGCFYLEEAEDVAADYSKTDFNMEVIPGQLVPGCYPMELTCTDEEAQMWTVNKVEGNTITLGLIADQKASAGRPFILLKGTTDDYDSKADPEKVSFVHGMDIVATADTINALRGSFIQQVIGAGVAMPAANRFGITKSPSQKVDINGVWVVTEGTFDAKTAVTIVFDENAADGITTALQNVSRNGAIYTIDGRLVSRKGNLNSLQRLPKGTYILNGTKVMVK